MSVKDARIFHRAQELAYDHRSGGQWNMVAIWRKGGRHFYGFNRLDRPAAPISDIYPEICGQHAELDLYRKHPENLGGGTVYVAGAHDSSGTLIESTRPCKYCAAILDASNVRFVVYRQDGYLIKARPKDLLT